MVTKLHSKLARATTFLRVAYSAPKLSESTAEGIRRFLLPATKALSFVKLKANDQPLWRPESFWHVEPTGKREIDVRLGRKYAREAIAAMRADHNSHLLAYVIQDIIKDAVQHAAEKKGRARRNAVVLGFLAEISEAIATTQLRLATDT
jgi:hypothetical protein